MVGIGSKIKKKLRERKWLKVRTWVLILVLVPLLLADAYFLRQNHIRMTELRDAVLLADEAEDDEAIQTALVQLKEYVLSDVVVNIVEENGVQRVTFGTGPFYLEHMYIRAAERALTQAQEELTSDSNPHGNIYAQASAVCDVQARQNGWGWTSPGYINCMTSEIAKYPAASEIQDTLTANLPSTELYRRNYASRVWAPTMTGVVLLLTAIVIVVIFIRMVVWIVLRLSLLFI